MLLLLLLFIILLFIKADYESTSQEVLKMPLSQYDVILCDVHMPGLNGLDLCRAIRGK